MFKIFIFLSIFFINKLECSIQVKFWIATCTLNECSTALNTCINCFGERNCKSCITSAKADCSTCANDIYNKDELENIGGNQYLICDNSDPIQQKVCHLFCRGQYLQTGFCVRIQNIPVCQCMTDSPTTTTRPIESSTTTLVPTKPYFNGTLKNQITFGGYEYVNVLPNGYIARGSDNLMQIWDVETGVVKKNLTTVYGFSIALGSLSNGDLITGYYHDKIIGIWDLKVVDDEPLKRFLYFNDSFFYLIVLENDDLIIASQTTFNILIVDSYDGSVKQRLAGHESNVNQLMNLGDQNLASCSSDGTVKIWNLVNGTLLKNFQHSQDVLSFSFLKNGNLVSGLYNGDIEIRNFNTGILIRVLYGHTEFICPQCLFVLQNGNILSGSNDGTFKIWNPYDSTTLATYNHINEKVYEMKFLPNGNLLSVSPTSIFIWS